jgi:hypothetical protein
MRFLRRIGARQASRASFCDSCGQVCTAACRSEALRDHTRTAALAARLHH